MSLFKRSGHGLNLRKNLCQMSWDRIEAEEGLREIAMDFRRRRQAN